MCTALPALAGATRLSQLLSPCACDTVWQLHWADAGIRYVTASQDADAYRGFHAQELRLGEPNPQGWSLEQIFQLDRPDLETDGNETELVLPSASDINLDISQGQVESDSDAGGSDRL